MGCSDSKQAAVSELNSMISQIKEENSRLSTECEKLKGENLKSGKKTRNFEYKVTFETLLRTLDNLAQEFAGEKNEFKEVEGLGIGEILEYEANLNKKIQKIKELVRDKEKLLSQGAGLDVQIRESEAIVNGLESIYFSEVPSRNAALGSSEIVLKKQDLLFELQKAEEVLDELNEEIRKSNIGELASTEFSSIENILELNDSQIEFELKKVDLELEELNSQIKNLKGREVEIQHIEKYINRSQNSENLGKSLTEQIKESEELVEKLEEEKNKVKEEISKLKKANLVDNDLDEKLTVLNEMIEKRKSKGSSSKVVSDSLVSDIQATLLKAKILEQDMRNKGV